MAFQRWQQSAAVAIRRPQAVVQRRAREPRSLHHRRQRHARDPRRRRSEALRGLVRDAGHQLRGAVVAGRGADRGDPRAEEHLRGRSPPQDEALAETIQILPTFQRETRATLERMDEFRADANPLIRDMIPVARELSPTLRSVRKLAPNLRNLFRDLDPLYRVSLRGLPALRDFLDGLAPVLVELDPFLANLNADPALPRVPEGRRSPTSSPVRRSASRAPPTGCPSDPAPRHFLRQFSLLSTETLSTLAESPGDESRPWLSPRRSPQRLRADAQRDLPAIRLQEHRLLARQPGSRRG